MKRDIVTFLAESVELPLFDKDLIINWLISVAASHGFSVGRLGYVFCDDPSILDINRQFLGHDYFTDIITFDYSKNQTVNGDMYISLDTVRSNSLLSGEPYDRELRRVIVHGLLHLCGIDDKGPGEREIMERHENDALALFDNLSN